MGISLDQWRAKIGCFSMPVKCRNTIKTLRLKYVSLCIRVVLFFLLLAEGIEANPGPGSDNDGTGRGRGQGAEGGRSPRGRGAEGSYSSRGRGRGSDGGYPSTGRGRGAGRGTRGGVRGGRGGRDWAPVVDIFANSEVETQSGRENRYNFRPSSKSSARQQSLSDWLISSQQGTQLQQDPPISSSDSVHSDLASETSDMNLGETADETNTTSLLLEIRRDVKKMHKRFDHIEKSVKTLKHDSKLLKDQNVKLSKQVTELQTTVANLESRAKEADIKNERLEAQSRRDNLRFHGFEDTRDETWEESENAVRSYLASNLLLDESSIQIERAHRISGKTSPRPIIVKFSFYKDRDKVLNAYRTKRKQDNERRAGALNGEGEIEQNKSKSKRNLV